MCVNTSDEYVAVKKYTRESHPITALTWSIHKPLSVPISQTMCRRGSPLHTAAPNRPCYTPHTVQTSFPSPSTLCPSVLLMAIEKLLSYLTWSSWETAAAKDGHVSLQNNPTKGGCQSKASHWDLSKTFLHHKKRTATQLQNNCSPNRVRTSCHGMKGFPCQGLPSAKCSLAPIFTGSTPC